MGAVTAPKGPREVVGYSCPGRLSALRSAETENSAVTSPQWRQGSGARIFLGLNPGKNKEFYTRELRDFFLSRGAWVERENVLFPPFSGEVAPA